MRFNRPLQAAKFFSPADTITLRELGRRAWIAGRDGTVVQSGGTGGSAICPWTGATIASGGICSALTNLPGIGALRLYHAQGERINVCSAMTSGASGLASNTLSGLTRTLVEDTSTGLHGVGSAAITLTDGASYSFSAIVSRTNGSPSARHIGLYVARSGQRAGVAINLDTGVATAVNQGGGSTTGITSTSLGSGRYRIDMMVTNAAWGGTVAVFCFGTTSATALATSYTGDGSGFALTAATLSAATFPGIGLAEGITRTADNLLWTPPAALSTTQGELYAFFNPYWSANAAAANPTAAEMRLAFHSSASISRLTAGTDDVSLTDAGGAQAASVASLAQVRGTIRMSSAKWGADLRQYRGATLAATDSTGITAPWTAIDTVQIASNGTPTEHAFGAVGLIYDPTPSDATRAALARQMNGRVVTVVA